jgi:YD repeat-containing protein
VTHAVPGQPARSVSENVSYLAGTRIVGSSVQFPGDARLERSLTRSFDTAAGNQLSAETVQGASLAARTWRYATPYQDGRYVAEATNPLGHTVGRTTDDRFGQLMQIVDPDGRSTIIDYDPFGRAVREIRPDGTEVSTRYERCDQADCSAVADAEPGIRVTVSTLAGSVQAAPTRVTYLDVLGREVLQEIEMLDPAQGWRGRRTGYDDQGRVQYVTRPVAGSAPPVCTAASRDCRWLTWDLVDRVVREDRPDGGVTITTFSPASGRVTVSRTETVKTPGLSNTSRTQRSIFDVLGQVTETRDAVGSSVGTTTAYTYDAHGNLATVTVAGTQRCDTRARSCRQPDPAVRCEQRNHRVRLQRARRSDPQH